MKQRKCIGSGEMRTSSRCSRCLTLVLRKFNSHSESVSARPILCIRLACPDGVSLRDVLDSVGSCEDPRGELNDV